MSVFQKETKKNFVLASSVVLERILSVIDLEDVSFMLC